LLGDAELWHHLALHGRIHISKLHGRQVVYDSFKQVVSSLMQEA